MNLDDLDQMRAIDVQNMLAEIDDLPAQLERAWQIGQTPPLTQARFTNIIIAGMGGSAIGADLLAAYVAPTCRVPVTVHRDYGLPAFANAETLVICSSHSGNTEETLSVWDAAQKAGCSLLAVCTGGTLEARATQAGAPLWKFSHAGQPRAAVGYSFGLLLALFARLNLIPNQAEDVAHAVSAMRAQQEQLRTEQPAALNPAKRYAGQLVGRWVTFVGSGYLAPVARRWKGQVNELAKAPANFEFLPEADHNTLAGIGVPEEILTRTLTLFLTSPSEHARNRLRADMTRQIFMLEGLNTDFYIAKGENALAHVWTAVHFGDYLAYYLAMAYGVDPTPIDTMVGLKEALKR
jgi:glucose/mannose-6-phosphate isomerase